MPFITISKVQSFIESGLMMSELDEYFTPDIMERVKNRIDLLIELKAQLG